jgi:hypothetical protein
MSAVSSAPCLRPIVTVQDNKATVQAFYQTALNDRDADAGPPLCRHLLPAAQSACRRGL